MWIRLPDTDARVFAQVALRHGVEVVAGRAMDPTGEYDDHLRVPFAYPEPVLEDAVIGWRGLGRNSAGTAAARRTHGLTEGWRPPWWVTAIKPL